MRNENISCLESEDPNRYKFSKIFLELKKNTKLLLRSQYIRYNYITKVIAF
jgi:hypothetical protein